MKQKLQNYLIIVAMTVVALLVGAWIRVAGAGVDYPAGFCAAACTAGILDQQVTSNVVETGCLCGDSSASRLVEVSWPARRRSMVSLWSEKR